MAGAVLLALGVAYTAITKGHIAVELLVERFSPRIQAIVNLVVNVIAIFFSFFLVKEMLDYATEMAAKNWSTGHLGLPIAPAIYLVAFGFGMLALVLFLELLKAVFTLINPKGSAS
jgi:TRAP-type C4-dicarboxylate transport system permease small subunit